MRIVKLTEHEHEAVCEALTDWSGATVNPHLEAALHRAWRKLGLDPGKPAYPELAWKDPEA
jgi:hypothetical protein